MACSSPFDAFRAATEYLSKDIYRRASFDGVMLNLIKRGIFAPNTGLTHSVFRIGKQEPTDPENAGTAITLVNGSNSGACAYNFTSVNWGYNEETYTPLALQWRGPLLCKDDQYFNHRPDDFLNAYVDEMGKYVQRSLEDHLFYHYARRVPIYVARSAFGTATAANTTFTAPAATSELTQQMLDTLAVSLIYERAEKPDSAGWITNGPDGPLFSLAIGIDQSQLILQHNSDFRNDLRYADMGSGSASELLKRLGATRTIKNFRHVPWRLPPRFTHDGTKYVRVPEFTTVSTSKGSATDVNPAYISPAAAPYEAALVLSPWVMEDELISPSASVGPVNFPATNYMGEWMWRTGPQAVAATSGDACYDPLEKFGRHFAEFKHALKPGALPKSGAIIFYKRCAASYDLVQCT